MFKSFFLMISMLCGMAGTAFAVDENLGCLLGTLDLKKLEAQQEVFVILSGYPTRNRAPDISITSPYIRTAGRGVGTFKDPIIQRSLFLYQRPLIDLKSYQGELVMRNHNERILLSVYRTEEENSKVYAKLDCPPNVQCKTMVANRASDGYDYVKKKKIRVLKECVSMVTMKFPNGVCVSYTLNKKYSFNTEDGRLYYDNPEFMREERMGCNL